MDCSHKVNLKQPTIISNLYLLTKWEWKFSSSYHLQPRIGWGLIWAIQNFKREQWLIVIPCWSPLLLSWSAWKATWVTIMIWRRILVCRRKIYVSLFPTLEYSSILLFPSELIKLFQRYPVLLLYKLPSKTVLQA